MADSRTFARFGTERRDTWWMEILPVVLVLGAFAIYATLRAFEGSYYAWGPYLSPFYSPLIDAQHRWWPWSPALIILGGPLGFRATCYYYRKAYYRAFFLDPPGCAVDEGGGRGHKYKGETAFPLILQNIHRYFFWIALIFLGFLWKDAIYAFDWSGQFGIGVGTIIMLVDVVLLTCYSFSCHSLRHMLGGQVDCFSCIAGGGPLHTTWKASSWMNQRHMLFAWLSLFSVGLTDLYIRLVAVGMIVDRRLL